SGSEDRLPPLPCTCTIIVVSAGGWFSGSQSAAGTLNPSIALIERNRSEAPGRGRMSSGRSAGGGAGSYSMVAAICVMLTENLLLADVFTRQALRPIARLLGIAPAQQIENNSSQRDPTPGDSRGCRDYIERPKLRPA